MFLSPSDGKSNTEQVDENGEECYTWCKSSAYDNLILKQKVAINDLERLEIESGENASGDINHYESPSRIKMNNFRNENKHPVIIINEDESVKNIEMATIESCFQRILTPEGNVKYKNYRILAPAPAPIRVYSPSGDIHTTPKKGKIVPKFDSFHDSALPREKLLSLINHQFIGSEELEAIIRPIGFSRKAMEIIRQTNKSSMEDRMYFLNSALFTPSPSSFSVLSEESEFAETYYNKSPQMTPEPNTKASLRKSLSIDAKDTIVPKRILSRQVSVPNSGDRIGPMSLSDELRNADDRCPRSHTPRTMTDFEYSYFYRPVSSLSGRPMFKNKTHESKKSILRNFVQKNMIDRESNRNKLAKLALAIEEDSDDDAENGCAFVASARQIAERLADMLDETKELRDELMDIQEDFQEDDKRVTNLLIEARKLASEFQALNYLDDVIALLNGDLQFVAMHKYWPFAACLSGHERDPSVNLIV